MHMRIAFETERCKLHMCLCVFVYLDVCVRMSVFAAVSVSTYLSVCVYTCLNTQVLAQKMVR